MKKIIILLTILISTFFSNVAFADILIPKSERCKNYNTEEYKKCNLSCSKKFPYQKWFSMNIELWDCEESCCNKVWTEQIIYLVVFVILFWYICFLFIKRKKSKKW